MATNVETPLDEALEQKIRRVITRNLTYHPNIPYSMLATPIRPVSVRWNEVLDKMVEEGRVIRDTVQRGRRAVVVYRMKGGPDPVQEIDLPREVVAAS